VGVIGAGHLGGFHAQKLSAMDGVQLVGVADPVPAHRDRVAAECRAAAYADFRALLPGIDAAVLAVPARLHHAIGRELLDRGIHLLVEKPLATCTAEADDLLAAARRSGATLQVGHIERFNPAFQAVAAGLGPPRYVEAVRAGPFTPRGTDVGVVLDLMIHDLDLVRSLAGAPSRRVDALGLSVVGPHEDLAAARLEFHGGCVAALSASRVSPERQRRMQLWSAEGLATIDFVARRTTFLRLSPGLRRRQLDLDALDEAQREHLSQQVLQDHLKTEQIEHPVVDALALELKDFTECIATGRRPRVAGEDGREAVALAQQILEKIRAHAGDDTAEGPIGPRAETRVPRPWFFLAPPPLAVPAPPAAESPVPP
jgi:predicted dehydrogenase